MKKTLPPSIEAGRINSEPESGPQGAFTLICPATSRRLTIIVCDGRDWQKPPEEFPAEQLAVLTPAQREHVAKHWPTAPLPLPAWEHVSVSVEFGLPIWSEMCWVKSVFWELTECVVQFHPPEEVKIDLHPVLHLWRVVGFEFPLPPLVCV